MLKPLLTKNEVSTHLVGASTGSTAQPPCRRGGLGGGSFNNKKKKRVTLQPAPVKPILTPAPHILRQQFTKQMERECLKCLFTK